ncbi:MAG: hypothetical protein MZW92_43735 [Comamonadaceae bacterium]|nr:hypothetical protein [Comamonadaceae bacterium]
MPSRQPERAAPCAGCHSSKWFRPTCTATPRSTRLVAGQRRGDQPGRHPARHARRSSSARTWR